MTAIQESRKAALREAMGTTRARTRALMDQVPDDFLKVRVHDFYSPIGWHFGHIGRTEELWVSEQALGLSALDDHLSRLFVNVPENPKDDRVHLPSRAEIVAYLEETRRGALTALEAADISDEASPLLRDGYAWEFARLHECQHQETIAELLQLIQKARGPKSALEMLSLPGGTFQMGSDDPHAYDNEKPAHPVTVAPFSVDKHPVSASQWQSFMAEGGYRRPELWSLDGWTWREAENVGCPEYWQPVSDGPTYRYYGIDGLRAIDPGEPVSSLSWFEADAYARWAGKRLPTEAEWEYAAGYGVAHPESGLRDMLGSGVWEWTASPFLPYAGFVAYPYDGYSKDHMDGQHKVCKGGSWATASDIARPAFRNWYVPSYRQGFLGLRCAL